MKYFLNNVDALLIFFYILYLCRFSLGTLRSVIRSSDNLKACNEDPYLKEQRKKNQDGIPPPPSVFCGGAGLLCPITIDHWVSVFIVYPESEKLEITY